MRAATSVSSAEAVVRKTLEGIVVSWNEAAEHLFGYSEKEIIGQTIHLLIPPDRQQEEDDILAEVAAGHVITNFKTVRLHKDGLQLHVIVTMVPSRDETGAISGGTKIARAATAGKLVEERFLESGAKFQATFENAAVGMAHVAPGGSWLLVNKCLCEITGCSEEELLTKKFQDITHPEDLPPNLEQMQRVLDGEIDNFTMEKRYLRKDGSIVWVKLTAGCVRNARGAVDYFISVVEDISKQKQAEELLRRQADLLDQSHDAILMWKPGGTITYWNRGAERLYGWPPEEAIGRNCHDLLRTSAPAPMSEIEVLIEQDGCWFGELMHTTRDGRKVVVESRHVRVCYGKESYALETNRDITARKEAEAALLESEPARRQAQEALRQSEARLRALIDTAADAIIVIDEAGLIQSVNPACNRIFGYAPDELSGKNVSVLMTEPDRSAHDGHLSDYLRTGIAKIIGIGREVKHLRKDGSVFDADLIVSEWQAGGKRYFTGIIRDITERKRHEEKIQLLLREVNHRAKNMLSVVQAVARRTVATSAEDFIERFEDRIRSLAASQDLLVRNEWIGADLDELIRSQLEHFKDLIGTRIELSGPPLLVNASAAQTLGMALHELATNAGKYGALAEEGGRVAIEWSRGPGKSADDAFAMSWREHGGKPVSAPSSQGFGSTVLGFVVRDSLDAKVELEFEYWGLSWRLECPAANVSEAPGAA